jgi:phospholipid transport system substrate-binding protein
MKTLLTGITVLSIIIILVCSDQSRAGAPLDAVQAPVDKVLGVLRDPALKGESKRDLKEQKIWSILESIFDSTELAKRTLARNWVKFTPDQQKEFESLFKKLLGNVYMDRILAYSDEKVVYAKELMLTEKTAEVQSKILTQTNEIPIYYRLTSKSGNWKVYDVLIEGVSLVQNYRSQFNEILLKKTPQDLLEILRKKVEPA